MDSSGRLGVGIVGTGMSAAMHAGGLGAAGGGRLQAVCGRDAGRVRVFADTWRVPRAYTRLEAMLADPAVDVVHLCTPPFVHEEQALAAIAAGKHLLIEKPIARTVAEAERIVAAARAGGVTLAGVFQHRFMPLPLLVRDAIATGRLGQLYLADASVKWWRADAYYHAAPWRGTRAGEGGGALINQGIHTLDLLLWLVGAPVEVAGAVATLAHPIEMEDLAVATLRFADGALGVFAASTAVWPGFAERIEVHGAGGSVLLNEGEGVIEWRLRGEEPRRTEATEQRGGAAADPAKVSLIGHTRQFDDLYAAIRAGRAPLVDGAEATRALAVIEALHRASDERRAVALPR